MVKRRYVRQKLYQPKAQWSNVAMSARNYTSPKLNGQTSLCPPEAISAQSFQSENKLLTRTHKINLRCRVSHPCRVDLGTQYAK